MMNDAGINSRTYPKAVILLGCLITAVIITVGIMATVPPVSRDALTHHLAVPKLYLDRGEIYEIPEIEFSYYPMNLDLLYMIPLYFKNDILPKFIHFAFGIFTAWLIFSYLKRRISVSYALFGALFFLTIPIIVTLCVTVYVDLGEIFFSFASILLLLKWFETPERKSLLMFSGIFCGLALGTKYNGLVFFLIVSASIPIFLSRSQQKMSSLSAIGHSVLFVTVSLLVFSPWLIKNTVWTGNPIYPLFNSFFQGVAANDGPKMSPFLVRKIIYQETWWETLAIPVRIFFQGVENDPKYFDGRLNPFLLILAIGGFVSGVRKKGVVRNEVIFFLVFSILYILFVFIIRDMRIRYVSPMLPPMVVLSVMGFQAVVQVISRKIQNPVFNNTAVILIAGTILLPNSIYFYKTFLTIQPISYLAGNISREAYIQKFRPEYAAMVYANQNLNQDDRIFALFLGNRRYYSERKITFDIPFFKETVLESENAPEIAKRLTLKGATHLLVAFDLFKKWASSNFTIEKQKLIETFFRNHTRPLFSTDGHGLYRLSVNFHSSIRISENRFNADKGVIEEVKKL
jgi:4-amino-4-deoxy-L-arabinose transferase-like glycosyltransferase